MIKATTQSADTATPQSEESNSPTVEEAMPDTPPLADAATQQQGKSNNSNSNSPTVEDKLNELEKKLEDKLKRVELQIKEERLNNKQQWLSNMVYFLALLVAAMTLVVAVGTFTSMRDTEIKEIRDEAISEAYLSAAHLIQEYEEKDKATVNRAINLYSKSIELYPVVSAYYNRGVTKSQMGKHGEAIADYSEVIKLDPELVSAYIGRGFANISLDKYDEARADFSKVLELAPENELAKQAIAEIEARDKND